MTTYRITTKAGARIEISVPGEQPRPHPVSCEIQPNDVAEWLPDGVHHRDVVTVDYLAGCLSCGSETDDHEDWCELRIDQ